MELETRGRLHDSLLSLPRYEIAISLLIWQIGTLVELRDTLLGLPRC